MGAGRNMAAKRTTPRNPVVAIRRAALGTLEELESRRLMSGDLPIRSLDGTGNNLANPAWGTAGSPYLRITTPAYADGRSAPAGAARPSARAVSNGLSAHPAGVEIENDRDMSAFVYAWGQFIDHDLDLTNSAEPMELFSITVPTGDPSFDPAGTGTQTIPLTRSEFVTGANGVRQQVNDISAYIDASMVYGTSKATADALRTMSGGKLKTSEGGLLPYNTMGVEMATLGGPDSAWFAAGDVRANENVELLALQTLFVREHNRLADQIAQSQPGLTDEQIYQRARRLVGAEIQAITYNEFVPTLLGRDALRPYNGYKPNVSAAVSNEFASAAFRFGHSMLPDDVEFLNDDGTALREEVSLAEAFFNPALFASVGPDPLLKYLASSNAEEVDTKVVDSLRNFLFGPPGAGGLDLVSLNIQRGRDHGLGSYTAVRNQLGLGRVTRFDQITSDVSLQRSLRDTYGTVDKIDLWAGGLAEDHARGASVGVTFQRILADQFSRTRDGDRYFYLGSLRGAELRMVQSTTLAEVIKRNTEVENIQPDVFRFDVSVTGRVFADVNVDGRPQPGERGLGGVGVVLKDEAGAVVQRARTDREGRYLFSDVELGRYSVSTDLPTAALTTPAALDLRATRGQVIDRLDFGARPPRPGAAAARTSTPQNSAAASASAVNPSATNPARGMREDLLS